MERRSIRGVARVVVCLAVAGAGLVATSAPARAETASSCTASAPVTQGLACEPTTLTCPATATNRCDLKVSLSGFALASSTPGLTATMAIAPSIGTLGDCVSGAAVNPACSVSKTFSSALFAGQQFSTVCVVFPNGPLGVGVGPVYTGALVNARLTCSAELVPR